MIIKRIITLQANNKIVKRYFFKHIENADNLDYSLVPLAYVITISSILWGFESNNNLNKNNFFYENFINNIFFNCLKYNKKSECIQLKKYLENEIKQINNYSNFEIKFKNNKPYNNLYPIIDINEE